MSQSRLSLAVIKMRLRVLSVLERLCANVLELYPGRRIDIHVVDPHEPGPGAVWRTRQSRRLLMNTVAFQVSLLTDPSVGCVGPTVAGPRIGGQLRYHLSGREPKLFAGSRRGVPYHAGSCSCRATKFVEKYRTAAWESPDDAVMLVEFDIADMDRCSRDQIAQPTREVEFAKGMLHPRRFAYGVPTEGVHWEKNAQRCPHSLVRPKPPAQQDAHNWRTPWATR